MVSKSILFRAGLIFTAIMLVRPVSSFAGSYVIGAGDTLQISVWGIDQLNFSAKVRPDGMITVPGLGEITAADFKPSDLEASLAAKLTEVLKDANPIVTVSVTEITNNKVYVFGGGVKSGIYNLDRKATLLQILCSLGEDVKNADLKNAYLLRNGVKVKTNFYNLFVKGDTNEDLPIESNDAIFIPGLPDKNIYVMGAVGQPKTIEYREGMTVMEAILEAGGFTPFASQNNTLIIRKKGDETVSIPVQAKNLFTKADLSQNYQLQPGDYVLVKESLF